MAPTSSSALVLTPEDFLAHWQGHRRVTRRIIDAFPESSLFEFSIGGMRPFSQLASEIIGMAVPSLKGVITGDWNAGGDVAARIKGLRTKADILQLWDETTSEINTLWPTIPPQRFQEVDTAFGQWKMPIYDLLFYIMDNEIHHRAQGYVYLRALEIEPPAFYDRS